MQFRAAKSLWTICNSVRYSIPFATPNTNPNKYCCVNVWNKYKFPMTSWRSIVCKQILWGWCCEGGTKSHCFVPSQVFVQVSFAHQWQDDTWYVIVKRNTQHCQNIGMIELFHKHCLLQKITHFLLINGQQFWKQLIKALANYNDKNEVFLLQNVSVELEIWT